MNNKYPPSYFESQCWYKNTYLVSQTNYICESNSVYNAGCHFTCIAMMFGVTPAYLSSLLSDRKYFTTDDSDLMWDQNRPFRNGDEVIIPEHQNKEGWQKTSTLKLIHKYECKNIADVEALVKKHSAAEIHFIVGGETHSLLIAGENDGSYYLWDPNTEFETSEKDAIAKCINGKLSLEWAFSEYCEHLIHLWVHERK